MRSASREMLATEAMGPRIFLRLATGETAKGGCNL